MFFTCTKRASKTRLSIRSNIKKKKKKESEKNQDEKGRVEEAKNM